MHVTHGVQLEKQQAMVATHIGTTRVEEGGEGFDGEEMGQGQEIHFAYFS